MNRPSAPGIEIHGHDVTVQNNTVVAHAIGVQNHATDAHVKDYVLDPAVPCEVGVDSSSRRATRGRPPAASPGLPEWRRCN